MQEVLDRARLVDASAFESRGTTATVPRAQIEGVLRSADGPPELVLDIERRAGDEVEADGCPLLQLLQEVEQRERVLAARDGDEDPIALLHEAEVLDGAAHVVEQPFLEAGVGLSHAIPISIACFSSHA